MGDNLKVVWAKFSTLTKAALLCVQWYGLYQHCPSLELKTRPSGLYYKHVTIVNYASSGVNKLKASLNEDARVVIYDHHMFIVQATGFVLLAHVCPWSGLSIFLCLKAYLREGPFSHQACVFFLNWHKSFVLMIGLT